MKNRRAFLKQLAAAAVATAAAPEPAGLVPRRTVHVTFKAHVKDWRIARRVERKG